MGKEKYKKKNISKGDTTHQFDERLKFPQFVLAYYEHQYDRFAKLEEQRLLISNIVLGISTLVFTFGFSSDQIVNEITGILLPVIVSVINIFAIFYAYRTIDHMRVHRNRAKMILQEYAEHIYEDIDQKIHWRTGFWSRWRIQVYIHIAVVAIALLIPLYFYRSVVAKVLGLQSTYIVIVILFCVIAGYFGYKYWRRKAKRDKTKKNKEKH